MSRISFNVKRNESLVQMYLDRSKAHRFISKEVRGIHGNTAPITYYIINAVTGQVVYEINIPKYVRKR